MAGASGKTSVRWGSLKRASQSCWNFVFQSGSLKSTAEVLLLGLLTSAKTPTFPATLVGGSGGRPELKREKRSAVERVEGRWRKVGLVVITCEMEPITEELVWGVKNPKAERERERERERLMGVERRKKQR